MSDTVPPSSALLYVTYFRVSTLRQGQSGLGLDAQREAVRRYVISHPGAVIREFTETESGKKANRPELTAALALCRQKKAVLLIAKLDRLARNVHFISGLLESGVNFIAADQPTKDRFMLHVQAAFAEEEARRISQRTKEALAAAKRRGIIIGATGAARAKVYKAAAQANAERFRPVLLDVMSRGATTTKRIRDELNALGISGPGGAAWHLPNLHRTLHRLGLGLQQRKGSKPIT